MTVLIGAVRCRWTPLGLKETPSARSAETTRCSPRALALGTLPLDPSQAVRQGREIEARSASSCCERPVRLRAARNMPPVISTIVMLRLFARRQRASMSAYFTNSLTPPARLGLLASPCGSTSPSVGQRVARSLPERWPAVLPRGEHLIRFKAINSRTEEGAALVAAPFQSGAGMDAKTRDLALLISLSLFCAGAAWILDYLILGSVFF